jgi:rhomboid protease GluP
MRGLNILSPSGTSLFVLGASGGLPVFGYGRWWTFLSAGWLHGGLLHIGFNMMWVRDLGPVTAQLYGPSRAVLIYVAASVTGFVASSLASFLVFLPQRLQGGAVTLGASAAIFGLLGALLYYGRRGGSQVLTEHATRYALILGVLGFVLPGVDNWAHAGGFAGGYLAALLLDPSTPERPHHFALALLLLGASAASVVASVVHGLRLLG